MGRSISVIIPVRDSESTIEKCLTSIKALNYPQENIEIIVIDDGSNDNTPNILKNINGIKILHTAGIGPSSARNLGIKEATGEFIAFTDADCIVGKNWINGLLKGFTSEDIASVGGNQLSPDDESPFGHRVQIFLKIMGFLGGYTKWAKNIVETRHNPTCNSMYRKSIFDKIGNFDEKLWPGEDVDIDYRIRKAGLKIVYNPEAIVYHYRPNSLLKFASMMYRYGKSSGGYLTRKLGFYRLLSFEPIFLFIYILTVILLFIANIWWGIFSIIAGILGITLFLVVKGGIRHLPINLMLFFTTIKFWNIGFITGFFTYRKNLKRAKN